MGRKKNKKVNATLVDLSDRKNIKIIHSKRTTISDTEIDAFEKRLSSRYNDYVTFTDACILKNIEINSKIDISSEQMFIDAMESMLEQNKLLSDMIRNKEQHN